MNVKLYITLLILLAINSTLCIKSLRSIVGPDHRKFFHSCTIPNPYIYTTTLIFFRNAWIIFTRKIDFFHQLYNLGIISAYSLVTHVRKNPTNCNATSTMLDIMISSVFLILSISNPCVDLLNHIKLVKSRQNHQPKPACSCTNRRKLRKKTTISVLKSISDFDSDSYPSVTNSDILITADDDRFIKVDQETQTVICFESKFCQHPNKDSMHFLRGNIPVQLIERSNVEEKFRVQSEMVCVKNKFLDCKNGIGDVKLQFKNAGGGFENGSLLTCPDAGDSDLKNSQMQRQIIMNSLKSHMNRNLNLSPTKSPSRIQTRNLDNGIVKIEDLISESGDLHLSMVPTKDVVVPTEVPKAVATALQSMVVNSHVQNVKALLQSNTNANKFKKWNKDTVEPERECTLGGENFGD